MRAGSRGMLPCSRHACPVQSSIGCQASSGGRIFLAGLGYLLQVWGLKPLKP